MTARSDLLAMLDASPVLVVAPFNTVGGINAVYDGYVKTDESAKVVSVELPYLVFYSGTGRDNDVRQSGQVAGRVKKFRIMGVAATPEQAEWVLERGRDMLSRKRLNGNLIIHTAGDDEARQDDYTRPGGLPLFICVDRYEVAV